jgi:hypothetical protein
MSLAISQPLPGIRFIGVILPFHESGSDCSVKACHNLNNCRELAFERIFMFMFMFMIVFMFVLHEMKMETNMDMGGYKDTGVDSQRF